MSRLELLKAHGCGNDVFLVDGSPEQLGFTDAKRSAFVRAICSRSSLGADGVYFIDAQRTIPTAWYFNSDGSPAEFCGNGFRCVGRWLLDRFEQDQLIAMSGNDRFEVSRAEQLAPGVVSIGVASERPIRFMQFGASRSTYQAAPLRRYSPSRLFTAFNGPNPHLISVVDAFDEQELELVGVMANDDRSQFANGINTSFVLPGNPARTDFYARTYERGAGFTTSCASGAAASAAALVSLGLADAETWLTVRNNGGPLTIAIRGEKGNL